MLTKTSWRMERDEVNHTKFVGPKGGVSERGIKDDRLVRDVVLKLVIVSNNRTVHEVHIPGKATDK
jgi:hypothetical protein